MTDLRETIEAAEDHKPAGEALDAATLRLASLPELEYEQVREEEAKRLGVRLPVLDKAVFRQRPQTEKTSGSGGSPVLFPKTEPWPEKVNGAELLDSMVEGIEEYVVMPKGGAEAVALWVLFAHTHDVHLVSPILAILAPERECGKSVLLETISWLVPKALPSSNVSPAAIYRVVQDASPTLLTDEMDTLPKETLEAVRGIYDAGHTRRFAKVLRTERIGDNFAVSIFSTWAPKALAQIGTPPETILGRSIVINMNRKTPTQKVKRLQPNGSPELHKLARMCARWSSDNSTSLVGAVPNLPEMMGNRVGDNWTPLFNIADVAGGKWPGMAREVAEQLLGRNEESSLGIQALEDINAIFKGRRATKLGSGFLCDELAKLEYRKWPEYGRAGKPISQPQLANLLKRYRISPKLVRPDPGGISGNTIRGYELEAFGAAFISYLPPQGVTALQPKQSAGYSRFPGVTGKLSVTPDTARKPAASLTCNTVTPCKGGNQDGDQFAPPKPLDRREPEKAKGDTDSDEDEADEWAR